MHHGIPENTNNVENNLTNNPTSRKRTLVVRGVVVGQLLAGLDVAQRVRADAVARALRLVRVVARVLPARGRRVVPVLGVVLDLDDLALPAVHVLAQLHPLRLAQLAEPRAQRRLVVLVHALRGVLPQQRAAGDRR
eukprot:6156630-Prymnesium_polylepis.1